MLSAIVVAAVAAGAAGTAQNMSRDAPVMQLYKISQELADSMGAYCLDGSLPGFYYAPAQEKLLDPKWKTSWVLYMQGGGFCVDEPSCSDRAKTDLGSSTNWPTTWDPSGYMDKSSDVSPFWYFNRVFLPYCDGFFFTSNSDDSDLSSGNGKLYRRGKRILKAVLQTLKTNMSLGDATDVLVGGGSAGGVATYLQADYISSSIGASKFRAAPVSGFFPWVPDYTGSWQFFDVLRSGITYLNATGGLDGNRCYEATPDPGEAWKCVMSNNTYNSMDTPTFVINSAVDAYAMQNQWRGDQSCWSTSFGDCSNQQIDDLNGWGEMFLNTLQTTQAYTKDGNGAFIDSCMEHCGPEAASAFDGYQINGVTLRDALYKWWTSSSSVPASDNTYLPCALTYTQPHQCNPTCSETPLAYRSSQW